MKINIIRQIVWLLLMLWGSTIPVLAQYNPDNPAEPDFPAEELVQYKVTLAANIPEAGTLTGAGKYKFGTNVTVKATTNSGYKFLHWLKDQATEAYGTNAQFTYTLTAADVRFTAVYEKLKHIVVKMADTNAGTVTSVNGYFQKGATVNLKTSPKANYEFRYWQKNNDITPYSTEATCTYIVEDEDVTFAAVYEYIAPPFNPSNPLEPDDPSHSVKYRVKVSISDEEAGLVTGAGSYMYGTSATISTSPTLGYEFLSWTKKAPSGDVEEFSKNKSFSYTIAAEDVEFVANYQWVGIPEPVDPDAGKHHLNLVAEPLGSCTFNRTNGELVADGLAYSVTATKGNADYVFKGWKLNGSLLPGESLTYSSIMGSEDITLTAVFEYNPDSPAEPEEDIYVEEAQTKGIKGDVNGDESVDTTDAIIVLNYYLGKTLDINKNAADVNEDKEIDTTDYILIINKYLNK